MGQEEGRETGRSGEPGLFPVLGRKVGLAAFCSGHRRNSLSVPWPCQTLAGELAYGHWRMGQARGVGLPQT